jgi:osmoprotectant transport system permease protein
MSYDLAASDNNPWFGLQYFQYESQRQQYLHSAIEQVELTVISVAIGIVLAFAVSLVIRRFPIAENFTIGLMDGIYSLPSIALFSILLPFTGLSLFGPIIGLTLYTQLILVRGFVEGFRSVPDSAILAADGMGYGKIRRIARVELRLAMPVIISSIRMASVSTVAMVPVAFILSHGGLGEIMTLGYANNLYRQQVVDAVIGMVILAILLDLIILAIGRTVTRWNRQQGLVGT